MKRMRFCIAAAEQRVMFVYRGALLLCRGGYGVEAAAPAELTARPGFDVLDSISALREIMASSGQKIGLKPGVYRVEDAWPGDPLTVCRFGGADNYFALRGGILQIDTRGLAEIPRGKAHELGVFRVEGLNDNGLTHDPSGTIE